MSQPLEFRFTDPAAPLFIDLEADNIECLFVISTSHIPGVTSTQRTSSQATNVRKRERSESEVPRIKKSMKVVQPANLDNRLRETSRASGSMPPPSMPPPSALFNRSTFHAAALQSSNPTPAPNAGESIRHDDPLFLPASQFSAAEEAVIRSTG